MDPDVIRASWARVKPHKREFARAFYWELFNAHPELVPMFPNSAKAMQGQRDKFLEGMETIVVNIENTVDVLVPWLHRLGRNHKLRYGVWGFHYDYVAIALLTALSQFDPEWNEEIQGHWTAGYLFCAVEMKKGERGVVAIAGEVVPEAGTVLNAPHGGEQAVTSRSIRKLNFRLQWRGFRRDDVRLFMSLVVGEVGLLESEVDRLTERLAEVEEQYEEYRLSVKNSDIKNIPGEVLTERRDYR